MRPLPFPVLAFLSMCLVAPAPPPAAAAPSWIWPSASARADEVAHFRKTFTLGAEAAKATLVLTCDNGATATLNGKEVLKNPDWQEPARANVAGDLKKGENELRVRATNRGGIAGLIALLEIELADGSKMTVETGGDWEAVSEGGGQPHPAVVLKPYGAEPWGTVFDAASGEGAGPATEENAIESLPGFVVDHLYTVPKSSQGSWVCLTADPKGRLIAGDQYGDLYRVTPPPADSDEDAAVERLDTPFEGGAHGLLYAFDSLYAMVNEKDSKGLWRLRDTDGDGTFDKGEHLRAMDGGGEHGPHAVVPGPDGNSLYVACGNHTKLPERMERSRAKMGSWQEDHLLPRMWDANGHARGVLAPGGYVCKTDPDGNVFELYSNGFRNQYDIAFDPNGELFTFDSDMEWDLGAPWYRPTRICHVTSGSEFGWRSGSGKWPASFPDSLPATVDVGAGSPTGVAFGTGAKFPARYQRALFANDWTYGTMYAIHLTPDGASFAGEKEEFLSGRPLPLTDLVVNPHDGALYFAIGGRRTQSALYRVRYTGDEPTTPTPAASPTPEAKLRHELESFHVDGADPNAALAKALPHLGHPDRFVRYAARVAVENQPVRSWADRALALDDPTALATGMVALARCGNRSHQQPIFDALAKLPFDDLDPALQIDVARACQLTLIRMGEPPEDAATLLAARLDAQFPTGTPEVDRQLVTLLVSLGSPSVVAKTLQLVATAQGGGGAPLGDRTLLERNRGYAQAAFAVEDSRPNPHQIDYMFSLRTATAGWTPELRRSYFAWFPTTHQWKGGNSFTKFIENIRTEAMEHFVPTAEKVALEEISKREPENPLAGFTPPKGPGQIYTVDDVVEHTGGREGLTGRNFERGKNLFGATACLACHHFNGDGGNVGPDLTGSGSRYTMRDLVENILEPSKVVSDQYDSQLLTLKDGGVVVGRVVVEENGKTFVMTNPFAPSDLLALDQSTIAKTEPYPLSMMPPGLINSLNPDEVRDLMAYILSSGNAADPMFAP